MEDVQQGDVRLRPHGLARQAEARHQVPGRHGQPRPIGRSLISERLAQTLGLQLHPTSLSIKAAQGSRIQIKGETNTVTFAIDM